jgi:hypothetical protein
LSSGLGGLFGVVLVGWYPYTDIVHFEDQVCKQYPASVPYRCANEEMFIANQFSSTKVPS